MSFRVRNSAFMTLYLYEFKQLLDSSKELFPLSYKIMALSTTLACSLKIIQIRRWQVSTYVPLCTPTVT